MATAIQCSLPKTTNQAKAPVAAAIVIKAANTTIPQDKTPTYYADYPGGPLYTLPLSPIIRRSPACVSPCEWPK